MTILHIDASARKDGSSTRKMSAAIVEKLGGGDVTYRDVANGLPFVTEAWVGANFTDKSERSDEQKAILAQSDALIAELESADTIVIGVPIYNFGIPAALKAWIDMVARARKTFKYTENGPVGLLEDKKVYLAMASGGTQIGSDIDFASTYMQHVLGFMGLNNVTIIAADKQMARGINAIEAAMEDIATI
jgi:FMN-dependent NADH-azoreductase